MTETTLQCCQHINARKFNRFHFEKNEGSTIDCEGKLIVIGFMDSPSPAY